MLCLLVSYFLRSRDNHLHPFCTPVSEFSVVFGPDQSWGIALVMSERQDDCCRKLSGSQTVFAAVSMYCSFLIYQLEAES